MKIIYLHIGPHKTGTTTIQHSLMANRNLLFQHGVSLLKTGAIKKHLAKQHRIQRELKKDKSDLWEKLVIELEQADAEKNIISSEELCRCNLEEIQRIKKYLSDYEVFVIFYCRRQDQRLQSLWAQSAKFPNRRNEKRSFYEWLEENKYQAVASDYFDLYKTWGSIFGEDHILVRIFEKDQFHGNLFQDFLTACDVENPESYLESQDQNQTPSIKEIILLQAYMELLGDRLSEGSLKKVFRFVKEFVRQNDGNHQKWNLVTREIYEKIMSHYYESNQKLAREYFHREDLFIEPFNDDARVFTVNDLSPIELLELNAFLIQKIELENSAKHKFLQSVRNLFRREKSRRWNN